MGKKHIICIKRNKEETIKPLVLNIVSSSWWYPSTNKSHLQKGWGTPLMEIWTKSSSIYLALGLCFPSFNTFVYVLKFDFTLYFSKKILDWDSLKFFSFNFLVIWFLSLFLQVLVWFHNQGAYRRLIWIKNSKK